MEKIKYLDISVNIVGLSNSDFTKYLHDDMFLSDLCDLSDKDK